MSQEFPRDDRLDFGRVTIDQAGRRLFVDKQIVSLEPRVFAVLLLLARHPGRAFARDEILDAVWGHRHVTPGTLNRAITLIRQALGDDLHGHQWIQTLYGVGYRFDAPANLSTGDSTTVGESPNLAAISAVPETTKAVGTAPAGPVAGSSGRHTPRAAASRWLLACCAVLALGTIGWWGQARLHTQQRKRSGVVPTLVVLPLNAMDSDTNERRFAAGLSDELITRLANVKGLRVIASTSAQLAQQQGFDAAQLSQRLHATHVLRGSLQQAGNDLHLDLHLDALPSGQTLWAQNYDRPLADVFDIQRDIRFSIASALRLHAEPDARHETDPTLYREYLEVLREGAHMPWEKGVALLRAFIAKAPDYARAHAALARFLATNIRYYDASDADLAEAGREAERALQLDPNLGEAQSALAILACRKAEWSRCVEYFQLALSTDPSDSYTRAVYAYWLAGMGYLGQALTQAEIGVELDPLGSPANFVLARILDTLGRHEDARRYVGHATVYAQWYNAVWRHDFTDARALVRQMPENEGFRPSYAAVTQALIDPSQWSRVGQLIEASEKRTGHFNFLHLMLPGANRAPIMRGLEQAFRRGWPSYYLMLWMPEYADLRGGPEFQQYLERTQLIGYWNSHGWPRQCRPSNIGADCK